MKITITLQEAGASGVKVKCDPPVWKLKQMAQAKVHPILIGVAGLALKRFFEAIPKAGTVFMPNDDQAFTATSAQQRQAEKDVARDKLLLPGRDF